MTIKNHSWIVLNDCLAVKKTDKSVFESDCSTIPVDIRYFFEIDNIDKGVSHKINIFYNGIEYEAKLYRTNSSFGHTKITWKKDLSGVINNYFTNVLESKHYPNMLFDKINNSTFVLSFEADSEYSELIQNDKALETIVLSSGESEGRKISYYTTRYERSPKNRQQAIDYWGTKCMACGFDFEKTYGPRGKGFIEVHHIRPLSSRTEQVDINPKEDLVCLCSNCHRMVHRDRNSILSLEQLIKLIQSNRTE